MINPLNFEELRYFRNGDDVISLHIMNHNNLPIFLVVFLSKELFHYIERYGVHTLDINENGSKGFSRPFFDCESSHCILRRPKKGEL